LEYISNELNREPLHYVIAIPTFSVLLLMLMAGTGRLVVFASAKDLAWTAGVFLFPIVGLAVALIGSGIIGDDFHPQFTMQDVANHPIFYLSLVAVGIAFFFSVIVTISVPIMTNGWVFGILIGVLRLLAAVFFLAAIIPALFVADGGKNAFNPRATNWIAILIFGIFFWMLRVLVNGERVMSAREQRLISAE